MREPHKARSVRPQATITGGVTCSGNMLPGSVRFPPVRQLREVLRDGAAGGQVLRAAYAPGVTGEAPLDAGGRLDPVGDGARGHGKDPVLGQRA